MYEKRILTAGWLGMNTPPEIHIILNSGGMDTLLTAHALRTALHLTNVDETVIPVFIDYGQKYVGKERVAATTIAQAYGLTYQEAACAPIARFEHPSGIVPFRNAELLLTAAQYGREGHNNVLYMGVLAHEINSDKSPEFLRSITQVLNISNRAQYWTKGRQYTIRTPLVKLTKSKAVHEYLRTGGDVPTLLATVSCYSGSRNPCGRCASCFKRWVALTNNGLSQEFEENPATMYTPEQLGEKLRGYAGGRRKEILEAVQKDLTRSKHLSTIRALL